MFGEMKKLANSNSLKDTSSMSTQHQTIVGSVISYTKTDKLITALYMVTDVMDTNEPLRNKLRTLGVEIISDIYLLNQNNIGHIASTVHTKVSQVMSFLELAFTINIVTEMNYSILRKEFIELSESIKESSGKAGIPNRGIDLTEFFKEDTRTPVDTISSKGHPIGHQKFTRIGVQKGSTLMRALKDVSNRMPVSLIHTKTAGKNNPAPYEVEDFRSGFDILKKQRRDDITNIIKLIGGSATIKDIKDKVQTSLGQASSLVSCGEKTLQRELVSMVKDGVLNKTGEKRWSRYFLKN